MGNNATDIRIDNIISIIREMYKDRFVTEICTLTKAVENPYAQFTDKRARNWWAQAETLPAGRTVTLERRNSVDISLIRFVIEHNPSFSDVEAAQYIGYRSVVTITVDCNGGRGRGCGYDVRFWESAKHNQETVDLTFDWIKEVDGHPTADSRLTRNEQKKALAQRMLILGILESIASFKDEHLTVSDIVTKYRSNAIDIIERLIESGAVNIGDIIAAAKQN